MRKRKFTKIIKNYVNNDQKILIRLNDNLGHDVDGAWTCEDVHGRVRIG